MNSIKHNLDVVIHSGAAGECYAILSTDQSHMVMNEMSKLADIRKRAKFLIKNAIRAEIYGGE